jgi:predicted ABC-type ATPase
VSKRNPPTLAQLLREATAGANRPIAVVLAGHNGSGKSTLWYDRLAETLKIPLINADRLTLSILPERNASNKLPDWATKLRDADERWSRVAQQGVQLYMGQIMGERLPFAFETVFSHFKTRTDGTVESKTDTIVNLQNAGYFVVLMFVGLVSAEMSILRVATRKAQGGHDVPLNKLRTRFPRTQKAIGIAAPIADMTLMFDNSRDFEHAFSLVRAQRGKTVLFDCRDSRFHVNRYLRVLATIWLRKVVGKLRPHAPMHPSQKPALKK